LAGSVPKLHGDEAVVDWDFFREEVGADGCFVAGAEFLVDLFGTFLAVCTADDQADDCEHIGS